ncbi:4'-phosphopantetheinyl transferase family protein [Zymobacter sp. IVIA_12111.31 C1]|uniref:4'-phosphopantetheinyl transferase family protein n=1 Tax=Zymobacter sp. IVIA_12111.31 C1 TaxID=3394854 RepID=UPI0039C4A2C4
MPASSFISALTIDAPAWPEWVPPESPLVLVQCHFSVEAYHDDEFSRHNIPQPPRLQRAVAKRRSEFLAGRICARQALAQLGIDGQAGSKAERRDPIWPKECTGTITHSHGVAAALVGHARHWQGLGIDIEHWINTESARHLSSAILQPHEQQLLDEDDIRFAQQLTLLFSAKESLFKALNPLTGTSFYFHDASLVHLNEGAQTLTLRLDCTLNEQWPAGTTLICHYAHSPAYITTWLTIPA